VKVVIAPDKFAGTLRAQEAALAMAAGWARSRPGDELVLVPMADGGEGTLEVVASAVPGAERRELEVADARGLATTAAWLLLPDGRALVEAAQACGLSGLPADWRNPRLATTYGVGQLIADAARSGAREIVVCIGGTATVDGGGGMATALGHRLLRADGNRVKVGGGFLDQVVRVEPAGPPQVPVVAALDVDSPLLGPDGAAGVYGPQKGAGPEDVALLEEGLRAYADAVERALPGGPWRDEPGAGAGGGLGFSLMALLGARVVPGARAIAELAGLPAALDGAEAVVTGEGSLDGQTAAGKAPAIVAALGLAVGARRYAIAGRVTSEAAALFDDHEALGPEGMLRAAELVEQRTAELAARVAD
jgi:glycerate kinase